MTKPKIFSVIQKHSSAPTTSSCKAEILLHDSLSACFPPQQFAHSFYSPSCQQTCSCTTLPTAHCNIVISKDHRWMATKKTVHDCTNTAAATTTTLTILLIHWKHKCIFTNKEFLPAYSSIHLPFTLPHTNLDTGLIRGKIISYKNLKCSKPQGYLISLPSLNPTSESVCFSSL